MGLSIRTPLRQLFSALALAVALGSTCHAQTELPGTDIRTYLTENISKKLSLAGTWIPIDTTAIIVGPFWNVIKLGVSQQEGVAFGGWAWNGSFTSTLPDVTPVRAALLEQQSNGKLIDATVRLLGNAVTNGAGSVIVADFNGDGLDDLVLPAHNESPFIGKSSIAYISRADGGFNKLTLGDSVMAHDARLVTIEGQKKIFAASFGGTNSYGGNLFYSWTGSTLTTDTSLGSIGGMTVLAGPFTGNSDTWLIIGDSAGGPGIPSSPTNPQLNYAYKYNAGVLTTPPVLLPKPYFNDKPAYAGFVSFWDPYSKTHTSRLWTTDLNQDGLPDILAGQELWNVGVAGLQKAVFQLLINRGNMVFTDDTDALAPEFNQDSYIDYSVRLADVDGSGIDTMFHSSNPVFDGATDAAKQGQYILVNDGTGRLYAAMHDEFRAMRTQIVAFLNPLIPGGGASNAITPQFIAYRTASGTLNLVAVMRYFMPDLVPQHRWAFVNVPLEINLTTDFRRDLTVATRNGSKRIRTFAGDDTIRRALSDPDCTIDGGLGTNTAVYLGNRAAWIITKASDKITVRPASGSGGADTLTRIQIAQFDDQAVDLTTFQANNQTIGTISFSPTALAVGGTTTVSATATSGLAVSFSSLTPSVCTVSGSTVTGIAAGACTIAVNQAGDASYSAATQVTWSIAINSTSAMTTAESVEFYNAGIDHYFITADTSEAAQIDNGSAGPGWSRTGNTFKSGGSTSICRFYGSYSPGPNSHFYTVDASECQGLKDQQIPASDPRKLTVKSWNFESLDFISTPPTTAGINGTCPTGTMPVYRAYNNGNIRGVDSNHRITSSLTAIQEVVSRGWSNEGVVMCAPN